MCSRTGVVKPSRVDLMRNITCATRTGRLFGTSGNGMAGEKAVVMLPAVADTYSTVN